MTADQLLNRLDGVQGRGPRWRSICPAHESRHRSRTLSIAEEADGRLLVHCHAGCSIEEVLGAVGLGFEALYPARPLGHHQRPVRKPWRASEVVAALKGELMVAFVVLAAVRAGATMNDDDRERAGVALDRIALFLSELDHAH
jgi:hypothetical protein